jgi:uncharacterized MAPEG superfamily protein
MDQGVVELQLLGAAVIIGMVQLFWGAAAARQQQGLVWAAGSRDEPRPVTGVAARLDRALRNFLETFPLFAAALLAVVIAGKTGSLSFWGAVLYVVARAVYVPIYASGVARIRSLIWFVAMTGLSLVVIALFV